MANKYLNKKLPPNASKGQKRLAQILDEIFCSNGVDMTIIYEYPLVMLSSPEFVSEWGVDGMSVDFYIKELNTAIEFQGEQHYKLSSLYGSSIYRDIKKRDFLEEIGVKLVEIPHTIGDNFTADDIREIVFGRATC